jgi:arsenate reductase
MPFPDPSQATGTHEEKMEQVRAIRDMIKARLRSPGPSDFDAAALLDAAE